MVWTFWGVVWLIERHCPPRWPHRTPLGCRDREHPPLGCRWVVRHAYVGGSRPNTVRVDAPRWPIVVPASALPATRARRWAHIGLRGAMGSVGGGLAPLDPTRHRPGQPPVYEATSDGHAGWVPTKAQRPNRPLCGLPVITQAAVWGCWVGETWPRGPAGLVHCGWGQWRLLCTSLKPPTSL